MSGLLNDVEIFLMEHQNEIMASTLGVYANNDARLVERLRNGGRVFPETEAKLRRFMAAYGGRKKRGPKPGSVRHPPASGRGRKTSGKCGK